MSDRDGVREVYDGADGRPPDVVVDFDAYRPVVVADLAALRGEIDELRAMLTELLVMARQAAPLMRLADNPAARFIRSVGGGHG